MPIQRVVGVSAHRAPLTSNIQYKPKGSEVCETQTLCRNRIAGSKAFLQIVFLRAKGKVKK